jgi:hypothetical protein
MFFGVGYVGTSRVEALCNILFDSFSGDRFIPSDKVQKKLDRIIREEKRLRKLYNGKY